MMTQTRCRDLLGEDDKSETEPAGTDREPTFLWAAIISYIYIYPGILYCHLRHNTSLTCCYPVKYLFLVSSMDFLVFKS
jgi:hypothetical protein